MFKKGRLENRKELQRIVIVQGTKRGDTSLFQCACAHENFVTKNVIQF